MMIDTQAEHDTVEIMGGSAILIFRCPRCDDIHISFPISGGDACTILNNQEAIQLADTLYRYARRVS